MIELHSSNYGGETAHAINERHRIEIIKEKYYINNVFVHKKKIDDSKISVQRNIGIISNKIVHNRKERNISKMER